MKEAHSIPEMLRMRAERTPDTPAHYTVDPRTKNWMETMWKDYFESAAGISTGLGKAGLKPGFNVAIMASTSQTWEFVQMGILLSGGAVVGIDPNETVENINHIVQKADLSGIVVSHPELMEKIDPMNLSGMDFRISMERGEVSWEGEDYICLEDIKEPGMPLSVEVKADDPATIIFTSGTTGEPKGIMYRHGQVLAACRSILDGFDEMDSSCNFPCWLPLSNLFQRMINLCAIDLGAATYFVEDPKEMVTLLPRINPHLFIGVPRVFEKIYEAIDAQIREKPAWQRTLIDLSIQAGDRYAASVREGRTISTLDKIRYTIAERIVLKKIRSFLGSNMKYFISGSAPMPKWLLERYHALGILVLEAYGISENIIPNAMNTPNAYRFGSVGRPRSENEIRILGDGELLVRGPGLFDGYYKSESTKDGFTSDGYFPTGDYVAVDRDGFLSVTGRKSEIFKTSTGRKIAPAGIEERLRQATYVEHAVVFGARKKFIIALVTVSDTAALDDLGSLAKGLSKSLESLPGFMRPAGILATDYPFSVETKELTGNFKLKRKNIESRFKSRMDELYRHLETGQETGRLPYIDQDNLLLYSLRNER